MVQILLIVVIVRLLVLLFPAINAYLQKALNVFKKWFASSENAGLFDTYYVDAKTFYIKEFGRMPCMKFMADVDAAKIFNYVKEGNAGDIVAVYQRAWYNWQDDKQEAGKTIFKLKGNMVIQLAKDYVEIYFDRSNYASADELVDIFKTYRAPAKEEDYEINIITYYNNSLDLKSLDIKPTDLDIDLYYNDDFKVVDATIRERLLKENDKGIILLHGLPGTGKTTYLRHLIGGLKKKILFVSPAVAGNLTNPEFIDLLLDNPNSVLVIEDAENIIMDRKFNPNSSVSNLLNISDGLLSDCLNVQLICTFNSAISYVDSALLRKGRLIAKYEFGKLSVVKAKKLAEHLNIDVTIENPMTLAEITNPDETHYEAPKVNVIGFRRELIET